MPSSPLSPTQGYAAGMLFALALHQAQTHQTRPLLLDPEQEPSPAARSISPHPELWVHHKFGLLRPVFRFLEIDSTAWPGIEETAASSPARNHVGAFLRLLSEDSGENSSANRDNELALSKAIDCMAQSMETTSVVYESRKEMQRKYEHEWKERFTAPSETCSSTESLNVHPETTKKMNVDDDVCCMGQTPNESFGIFDEDPMEGLTVLRYERRVLVVYELLSACLADKPCDDKTSAKRKGFDSRHRVALRLVAAWLDLKWIKMEAMETMVAFSSMALSKVEQANEKETKSCSLAKWKRGGIIGAAALTGGALLAITGGLAAPAIATGFSALAPTLGTLIPVIGASGFAAAASATATVAGSVAVAASFGAAGAGLTGSKMARRIGDVNQFDFKAIGDNHKQGRLAVEILVSGFVFEEEDFVRPWEGLNDNMERYVLQWESKNLIAVSTAIQDWLTSRIAMALMKQGAMLTVLSALLTALAWPATLIAATDFIDSKWTIAVDRSNKAGRLLADVLLNNLQGFRPVTLVGFSLGARVVFKCLQHLAESEHNAGLVERVVLLGAPIPIKGENWEAVRKIVSGRFVNAYSTNDWILGVAFRASLLSKGLAGIQPIDIPGIESVDVTKLIEGHSSYLWATQEILESLEMDCFYPVFSSTVTKS